MVVGRGAARDLLCAALLADVLGVLDVELVQRLDVLVDEGDRDEHKVSVTPLDHDLKGVNKMVEKRPMKKTPKRK